MVVWKDVLRGFGFTLGACAFVDRVATNVEVRPGVTDGPMFSAAQAIDSRVVRREVCRFCARSTRRLRAIDSGLCLAFNPSQIDPGWMQSQTYACVRVKLLPS